MHAQARYISSARKLLESLVGNKFSVGLQPVVDMSMHADREIICQSDQQTAAEKSPL